MRVSVSDGLQLALDDAGTGAPVLLVHGFGGSRRAWGAPALDGLRKTARVLAVDLIGHGASGDPAGPERVALGRVLDDLERALDAAAVDACTWVGYSMGGRIALGAALLRADRVKRLVLESASPGLASEDERRSRRAEDEARARRIEDAGVEVWAEEWEQGPLFAGRGELPPAVLQPFRRQQRENRAPALAAWLRGLGTGTQPSFWDRLEQIATPVLLVTGADDARYGATARQMSARLPEARHVEVPGAGHTVHLEQPDAWVRAVTSFLDGGPD